MRSRFPWLAALCWLSLGGCSGPGDGADAGPPDGVDAGGTDGSVQDGGDRAPPPVLDSIEPAEGPAAGGTAVVLHGDGFQIGASVRFGAVVAGEVRVASASRIEAFTPPGSPGTVSVRVTNPDGQRASLEGAFTYLAPVEGDCPRESGCEPAEALFEYSGNPGDQALLAADFTGWRDGAIPMANDGLGNFTATVVLREGRYEYKYIVNDTEWVNDPVAPSEPFFGNSVRFHDNPCTPNLIDPEPAYGVVSASGEVSISATYLDAESAAGLDPASICLVVDGERRRAAWDPGSGRVVAVLSDLPEGDHDWWMSAADAAGHRSAEVSGMFTVDTHGEPPEANGGHTQFVYAGGWAVLDATGSRDPDGVGPTAYTWTQTDGPAVALEPQHVTPHEGYDLDPAAEPPRTEALMGFSPPAAGPYRFTLTVSDDDGPSAPAVAEVIALQGGAGAPRTGIVVSGSGDVVEVDAGASTPGASFRWYADIRNPAAMPVPTGGSATFQVADLPVDGVYFVHVVASLASVDGVPATVLLKRDGQTIRGWDLQSPPDWLRDAQIYEVYVRSFADGNDDGAGDLPGLTDRLDYLDDLGVNTLWLMPVFESADHAHGYHTVNYRRAERDYGTNDDLVALIAAAHQRGMRVVLDLVINHTSRHHPRFQASLDPASRFHDHYIWFVNHTEQDPLIQRYGFGRELGGSRLTIESGWGDIPDVNLSHPQARAWAFGVARHWMDPDGDGDCSDGVDGFRLDHVTGPSHRVWRNLRYELKSLRPDLLLLAEVFRDFDNADQGYGIKDYYGDEFDLAFTFPFYWVAQGVFKNGEPVGGCAEPCGLDWLMGAIEERFSSREVMCFFVENHDVPWYTTVFEDWGRIEGKLVAAVTLMQTLPNSPQMLYGLELGTSSWRGFMPWAKDTPANTLKAAVRQVMHLRRDHEALRRGGYQRLAVGGSGAQDVFAFARTGATETVVVVVNVRGMVIGDVGVDLTPLGAGQGRVRDLLHDRTWPLSSGWLGEQALQAYEAWVGVLEIE